MNHSANEETCHLLALNYRTCGQNEFQLSSLDAAENLLNPLPKYVLHRVPSSASAVNFQYDLVSLTLSSSCLCFLHRLPFFSLRVLEGSSYAR